MRKVGAYGPALILLVGTLLGWRAASQRPAPLTGSLTSVLSALPGYSIREQRISEEEARVAGMTDYVARSYSRDGAVAFTTLVSYYSQQTQGRTIHSPRNCLPGAGWEVLTPGTRQLVVGGISYPVNQYVLKKNNLTAVVLYWYQGRGRVVADEYQV